MSEYLDAYAPQWIDFTKPYSPQVAQDFFDKAHTTEPIEKVCESTSNDTENAGSAPQEDASCLNKKLQEDLNIIRNTPVKIISPKSNNKTAVTVTVDQVLNDAMRKLELCNKIPKNRNVARKTQESNDANKTPSVSKITKSSRSIDFHNIPSKCPGQDSAPRSMKINKNFRTPNSNTVNTRRTLASSYLFKQTEDCTESDTVKRPDDPLNDLKNMKKEHNEKISEKLEEECDEGSNEKDNKECEKEVDELKKDDDREHCEEDNEKQDDLEQPVDNNKDSIIIKEEDNQDNVDAALKRSNRTQSNRHTSVLTWQNHRRSTYKRRMSGNKHYISLAEAVSRFQNETPKRFHTRSFKENNSSALISKLTQNRLKTTIPVSPALVAKTRTRAVTVLSQEERELLELKEMKKHQIRAKPVPSSVLRAPRVLPKVIAKKPTAVANTCSMTQSGSGERARAASLLQNKKSSSRHDEAPLDPNNVVTKVMVTDPAGFIVEQEEISGVPKDASVIKSATRDQALQMKQQLRTPQDANNVKEFHAASSHRSKNLWSHLDKAPSGPKNMIMKVTAVDSAGFIVEQEKVAFFGVPKDVGVVKNVTRVQPFSFEARNKDLLMKKEQRLKSLQEAKSAKVEFHARPAPNFSKPLTPSTKQQQHVKKLVEPCPFSFEERNKQLSKRKEQLVKQVLEVDRRSRMFRANPAPSFKPVMVRGRSKDRVFAHDTKAEGEPAEHKCEDQENREPNVVCPTKTEKKSTQETKSVIGDKQKATLKDKICPPELSTDKRAKERREFDERLRHKEMEEETKREEDRKRQLEHERQMRTELRKLTETKAKPMPTYKPMHIVKSMKQLTDPQSPAFASKFKSKQA